MAAAAQPSGTPIPWQWGSVAMELSSQENPTNSSHTTEDQQVVIIPKESPFYRPPEPVYDHKWVKDQAHHACIMYIWGRLSLKDVAMNLCKSFGIRVIPDQVDDMLNYLRQGALVRGPRPVNFADQGYQAKIWGEVERTDRWSLEIQRIMRKYRIRQYGWAHQLQDDAIVMMQLFTNLSDEEQAKHLSRIFHGESNKPYFPVQTYTGWSVWNRYYEIVHQWNGSARFWADAGPNNGYAKQMMGYFGIWEYRIRKADGSNASNAFPFPTPYSVSEDNHSAVYGTVRPTYPPKSKPVDPKPEPGPAADYVTMHNSPKSVKQDVPTKKTNVDGELKDADFSAKDEEAEGPTDVKEAKDTAVEVHQESTPKVSD